MDISPLIRPTVEREELARVLDGVGYDVRLQAVAELGRRDLASLYDAAAANAPLSLDDFVPPSVPPLVEIIHEGKNSLPLFTRFQKRMCRPADAAAGRELWGYNEQAMRPLTGPGYFIVRPTEAGEIAVDYTRLPPAKPEGWPPLIPNSARLARLIYYGTVDIMRRVSHLVTIGRARRGDQPLDAWFVLVRRDPAAADGGGAAPRG